MAILKKLNLGIVRAVYIANVAYLLVLKSILEVTIAAICDMNITLAQKMANSYAVPKYYSDMHKMLNSEKLDLLDICTNPDSHKEKLFEATDKKIKCIVEKL